MVTLETKWFKLIYDEKKGFIELLDKLKDLKIISHAFTSVILSLSKNKEIILSSHDENEKYYEVEPILDNYGKGKSLIAKFTYDNEFISTLTIIIYETKPFITFQTSIQSAKKGYRLKMFFPLILSHEHEGHLELGMIKDWRLLRQDWQSWSPIEVLSLKKRMKHPWVKIPKRIMYSTEENMERGEYLSDNFAVIKNIKLQRFITIGFISMKEQLTHIGLHIDYEKNKVLKFFARSLLGEIPLKENIEIHSEKLILIINGMDVVASLDYYASITQKEMKALSWDPIPAGWCSWYYYYSNRVSENAILQHSEYLSIHRKELPMEWVQLDDGYFPKTRFNSRLGDWLETNERFPNGLEWLANEIKADGFRPALWIAPFLVSRSSKLFLEHPDWVIHDKKGKPIQVNLNPEWGTFNKIYALDCTHPEVQEWLRALFQMIVEKWGYQFLKLDFLYAAAIDGIFYDQSLTRIQAYRKGLEIIRETVGDNIFLLGCGAPLGPSIGLVNAMRVGGDTYHAFDKPFFYWLLNIFFFAGLKGIPSMADALQGVMLRSFMHKKFWLNDPDCLLVRRTRSALKSHEIEFEVTLIGLCGGLLFSSDNLLELTLKDLEYIKFLLPNFGEHATPIDLFENMPPTHYKLEITPKALFEQYNLVGIFNWMKKEKSVLISVERLQLKQNLSYHVFDFWEKRYFQINSEDAKIKPLRGHSAKFLIIRPITGNPQLIASTFHLTQGLIEVSNFEFKPISNEISIEIIKSGRNRGQLYIYIPDPYQEKELSSSASRSSMFRQQDDLLVIELQFEDKTQLTIKLNKT